MELEPAYVYCVVSRSSPFQHDAATGVDGGVEGGCDEGGGLVLGDDGGAGEPGAGGKIGAPVDRHFNRIPGLRIEETAAAGLQRRIDSSDGTRGGGALGLRAHGQGPGQDLDRSM